MNLEERWEAFERESKIREKAIETEMKLRAVGTLLFIGFMYLLFRSIL